MTTDVKKIAEQIKALPKAQFDEFLNWLADYELEHFDDWDKELERDSQPGGKLDRLIEKAQKGIAAGKTKPLDEFLDDA